MTPWRGSVATNSPWSSIPVADAPEAHRIADRIAQELREPFPLNGRDWFLTASIGIALAGQGRGRRPTS